MRGGIAPVWYSLEGTRRLNDRPLNQLALAGDNTVAKAREDSKTSRSRVHQHAAAVGFIGNPHREAEARKRIKRAAHRRFTQAKRLGKTADSVRPRLQRNSQENGGLSNVEIWTIGANSFRQYVFE
jgi:hypothetical protein